MKHLKKFNELLDPMGKWTSGEDDDVQNPKFTDKNAEDFLTRLGVKVTKATGEYKPGVPEEPNVDIRPLKGKLMYGFKKEEDCISFQKYLTDNEIKFNRTEDSIGARYPYHVILIRK